MSRIQSIQREVRCSLETRPGVLIINYETDHLPLLEIEQLFQASLSSLAWCLALHGRSIVFRFHPHATSESFTRVCSALETFLEHKQALDGARNDERNQRNRPNPQESYQAVYRQFFRAQLDLRVVCLATTISVDLQD